MKIKKRTLQKALQQVKDGLASKEIISQSTSFCFLNGNVITYNDEISISCPLPELDLEGAINATELYDFVNKVKSEEITLEVKENEILLKAGRSKAGLTLQSEISLPISEVGEIKDWKKLPEDFSKALSFARGACSRDMSDPKLTAVHINGDLVEGSDGFRIVNYHLSKKVRIPKFLIPAEICGKIIKMNPLEVAEGTGWVHFRAEENAVLSCRVFEEDYVNTAPHMNISDEKNITFPKEILEILDRAGVFSKREHNLDESVSITLSNKRLTVKSKSDSGWFEEKSRVDFDGDDFEFSITPYLLRDILTETIKGKINENILLFENENWKYLTVLRTT